MKYIDAGKLIAEIERFSATEYDGNTLGDDVANSALDFVIKEIIPSLQQEQLEVDFDELINDFLLNNSEFLVERDSKVVVQKLARHFYELGFKARK